MSNPEIGEAYVKIRPVVDEGQFTQQVGQQIDEGIKRAQAAADKLIDDTTKRIADLNLRAQAAALRGQDTQASRLAAQAQLEQVLFAAQQARKQASEAVGQDQAAFKELLLASADAYEKAAVKLQGMIERSQASGRPVGSRGAVGSALETLERASGGRTAGMGGLLAGAGRLGVAGFVATSVFQGLNELQGMLRVTGEEAFTTQGRFRNLGAELMSGNLIGGIKALAREPKTLADLGMDAREAAANLDELKVAADAFGGSFKGIYEEAKQAAEGVRELDDASKSLLNSALAFRGPGGQTIFRGGFAGLTPAMGIPPPQQPSPFAANAPLIESGALAAAERADDLKAQAQILVDRANRAKYLLDLAKRGSGVDSQLYKERYDAYQDSLTALDRIRDRQRAANEAARKAAKDAADAAKRQAESDAEAARRKAEETAANIKSAKEQALENDIARAAMTQNKVDDKKAFDAALDYWRALAKHADNAKAREEAQAKVIELRKRMQDALKGDIEDANQVKEQQLQNRVQAANLTTGVGDNKKAVKDLIAFYRSQFKGATDLEKAQLEGKIIAQRLALKNMSTQSGESPDVFANRLFTEAADQFRRFGSNIASSSNGILSPQDARGAFAGILMGGAQDVGRQAQATRTAQLDESRKQTALLQVIANGPVTRIKGEPLPKEVAAVAAEISGNVLRGL